MGIMKVAAGEESPAFLDETRRQFPADRPQAKLDEIPRWDALVVSDADGALVSSLENRARGARLKQPSLFLGEYRINCTEVHPQYAP